MRKRTMDKIIYNCEKICLGVPDWLYSKEVNKDSIVIDTCLSSEIQLLWEKGIHTRGCCCGHGKLLGTIIVENEDIPNMYKLGYQNYIYDDDFGGIPRKDTFIAKSTYHTYNGYSQGFLG